MIIHWHAPVDNFPTSSPSRDLLTAVSASNFITSVLDQDTWEETLTFILTEQGLLPRLPHTCGISGSKIMNWIQGPTYQHRKCIIFFKEALCASADGEITRTHVGVDLETLRKVTSESERRPERI